MEESLTYIRRVTKPDIPNVLKSVSNFSLSYDSHEALGAVDDHEDIEKQFPHTYGGARISFKKTQSEIASLRDPIRMGVVLSGGQAPGGHNVIAGIFDFCKSISSESVIYGFLDGPQGIYNKQYCIIDDVMMDKYRNTGGFDMIGSGRHKIEKPIEFERSMQSCVELNLDGIIIIGGDDSNTNAAVLAEYFAANKCKTKVCGAPKTIDGDLKVNPYIPISFGFDTACRLYSELIGNLGQDTLSSQKYYHFIRLMGRAASNITLECGLMTRPNICLISEEVEAKKLTLLQITQLIVDVIINRSQNHRNYGIIILPEGLIEFIPEFNHLIEEINDVLATGVDATEQAVVQVLSPENRSTFLYLPDSIKQQLLLDRDPHGNVQVAKIETERLLALTVSLELKSLKEQGKYHGEFMPQYHSFGYEGRCGFPSPFDATYCYTLGQTVAGMISLGLTGMIASVTNLTQPVEEWDVGGVPITMMCHMERRHGHMKPVIKKALVELDGLPYKCFVSQRDLWAQYDLYRSPGPIQFFSSNSSDVDLCITLSLELGKIKYDDDLASIKATAELQSKVTRLGSYIHTPLSGHSKDALSLLQKDRSNVLFPLCDALNGVKAVCTSMQLTSCKNSRDRAVVSKVFQNTYGSHLVSLTSCAVSNGHINGSLTSPLKVGILFSGRQSPGGHNVIAGVFDSLKRQSPSSTLVGFIGGCEGLIKNHAIVLTEDYVNAFRGQGGFEMLSRSYDSFPEKSYDSIIATCNAHNLDGLLVIGGARSATNCAYLAEYLKTNHCSTAVVAIPVDISGSLKDSFVETTVGFDTATKVASQVVGNNATDGSSAKKYYYFMRLMSQEKSFSVLEIALATKPNYVILTEEVKEKNMTLSDVVRSIADMVENRAKLNKNYGTVLIPEGLIDSIPELKLLVNELDKIFLDMGPVANQSGSVDIALIRPKLTHWSCALLDTLPDFMQYSLLLTRGSDNKALLSQLETEKLLAHFVEIELGYRKKQGTYKGTFSVVNSFIGYQSRGAIPSNFDNTYAYNLGFSAITLVENKCSSYMACIHQLKRPVKEWTAYGVPLTAMMTINKSPDYTAVDMPIIKKASVDLNCNAYGVLVQQQANSDADEYHNPGPLQLYGPDAITMSVPKTVTLDSHDYMADISMLAESLIKVEEACRPGCSQVVLEIATKSMSTLIDVINVIKS